ncbi:MAG: hypothetical protein V4690_03580 [Patescibacteria group bacterium]
MPHSLIKHTLFLTFLIGVLDLFANKFYFYWSISWFDMLMHFLAGVLVAFFVCLFAHYFTQKGFNNKETLSLVIVTSLLVGIFWEWYELHFQITSLSDGFLYYRDTISDLLLDMLGGAVGFLYAKHLKQ